MAARVFRSFAVEGSGDFPFELLRRERCWPASAEDAVSLGIRLADGDPDAARTRHITLETASSYSPNRARWRSRGWRVID